MWVSLLLLLLSFCSSRSLLDRLLGGLGGRKGEGGRKEGWERVRGQERQGEEEKGREGGKGGEERRREGGREAGGKDRESEVGSEQLSEAKVGMSAVWGVLG